MKNNTVKKMLLILLIIILIILILFWVKDFRGIKGEEGTLVEGSNGLLPGITKEEAERILQEKADASVFSFDINATPTFENGSSKGNVRIANPPYNVYDIKVTIRLDDSGDLVLQTDKLKPNQYIETAKLSKKLSKGEYDATATLEALDMETGEYLGEVQAMVKIKILN